MSYWLYHEQMPLCRVRRLVDARAESGTVVLSLPANLVSDMSVLTDELELYEDQNDHLEAIQALAVRATGDEVELTIMAMGHWTSEDADRFNDDWLLVDGLPLCTVENCKVSPVGCPKGPHVRCSMPGDAFRQLNYRRRQLKTLRRIQRADVEALGNEAVGLMLPLIYDGPRSDSASQPVLELLRLRDRVRLPVDLELADAGDSTLTIVGHTGEARPLGSRASQGPPVAVKAGTDSPLSTGRASGCVKVLAQVHGTAPK